MVPRPRSSLLKEWQRSRLDFISRVCSSDSGAGWFAALLSFSLLSTQTEGLAMTKQNLLSLFLNNFASALGLGLGVITVLAVIVWLFPGTALTTGGIVERCIAGVIQ